MSIFKNPFKKKGKKPSLDSQDLHPESNSNETDTMQPEQNTINTETEQQTKTAEIEAKQEEVQNMQDEQVEQNVSSSLNESGSSVSAEDDIKESVGKINKSFKEIRNLSGRNNNQITDKFENLEKALKGFLTKSETTDFSDHKLSEPLIEDIRNILSFAEKIDDKKNNFNKLGTRQQTDVLSVVNSFKQKVAPLNKTASSDLEKKITLKANNNKAQTDKIDAMVNQKMLNADNKELSNKIDSLISEIASVKKDIADAKDKQPSVHKIAESVTTRLRQDNTDLSDKVTNLSDRVNDANYNNITTHNMLVAITKAIESITSNSSASAVQIKQQDENLQRILDEARKTGRELDKLDKLNSFEDMTANVETMSGKINKLEKALPELLAALQSKPATPNVPKQEKSVLDLVQFMRVGLDHLEHMSKEFVSSSDDLSKLTELKNKHAAELESVKKEAWIQGKEKGEKDAREQLIKAIYEQFPSKFEELKSLFAKELTTKYTTGETISITSDNNSLFLIELDFQNKELKNGDYKIIKPATLLNGKILTKAEVEALEPHSENTQEQSVSPEEV